MEALDQNYLTIFQLAALAERLWKYQRIRSQILIILENDSFGASSYWSLDFVFVLIFRFLFLLSFHPCLSLFLLTSLWYDVKFAILCQIKATSNISLPILFYFGSQPRYKQISQMEYENLLLVKDLHLIEKILLYEFTILFDGFKICCRQWFQLH